MYLRQKKSSNVVPNFKFNIIIFKTSTQITFSFETKISSKSNSHAKSDTQQKIKKLTCPANSPKPSTSPPTPNDK